MNQWLLTIHQDLAFWMTVSLAVSLVLFLLLIVLWVNLLSFKKKFKQLMKGTDGSNLEKKLQSHLEDVAVYEKTAEENKVRMAEIEKRLQDCVQYVGTKRYNAFEDMGSRLSYSIALLDNHLDGVLLTGIYGRYESTTYAKMIHHGHSEQNLSVEEMDALQMAKEQQKKRNQP